jgi:predicted methyltransferase MtxX (methanogen marker protein 4)
MQSTGPFWSKAREFAKLGRPRIAIGLGSADAAVIESLTKSAIYADLTVVAPSGVGLLPGFSMFMSDNPEETLASMLVRGHVDGIVRGTLDDRTTLRAYLALTGETDTTCPALFEDPFGRQFFVCPSSNPDGWTKDQRFVEAKATAEFVSEWGLVPRIAVYTSIRKTSYAAVATEPSAVEEMQRATFDDADWIVGQLIALGYDARNWEIDLNEAVEDLCNIHVPVNGVVGNQICRTLMFCGGRMLTATRIGLSRPYEDNSKSERDFSVHIEWLAALINRRRVNQDSVAHGLLPPGAPNTVEEVSARIYSTTCPGIDDLRLMALLEASGKGAYEDLALAASNSRVADLLRQNGREELAHAHRVRKALKILTGVDYDVPPLERNPYYKRREGVKLTPELLRTMAASELNGEALYRTWAAKIGNAEAAALFSRNGVEERVHGARLEEAAALME